MRNVIVCVMSLFLSMVVQAQTQAQKDPTEIWYCNPALKRFILRIPRVIQMTQLTSAAAVVVIIIVVR